MAISLPFVKDSLYPIFPRVNQKISKRNYNWGGLDNEFNPESAQIGGFFMKTGKFGLKLTFKKLNIIV